MAMKKKDKANFYLKMNIGVKIAEAILTPSFLLKLSYKFNIHFLTSVSSNILFTFLGWCYFKNAFFKYTNKININLNHNFNIS